MKNTKTNGWFKVYWNFLDNLSPESALFLSYLIDIEPLMKNRDGEYFRLSNSFIQERFLTWSNYTIKTRFDELIEKGYVELKEKYQLEHGNKCKTRWVKINDLNEDLIKDLTEDLPNDLIEDLTEKFNINNNNNNNNINNINNKGEASSTSVINPSEPSDTEFFSKKVTINNEGTPDPSEGQKPKRMTRKDQLTEYVKSLTYSDQTKEVLMKWIFQIGLKGGVTLEQLQDKMKQIWNECNDELLVREAINNSYLRGWFGFFKPNQNSSQTTEKNSAKFNTNMTHGYMSTPNAQHPTAPNYKRCTGLGNEIF